MTIIIKELEVSNFRSFKDLKIQLRNFNVLIGANAAGKSNFIEILKFLRAISQHGLKNAMSMQGGIKYARNVEISSNTELGIRVVCEHDDRYVRKTDDGMVGVQPYKVTYQFGLKFENGGYEIVDDRIEQEFIFFEPEEESEDEIGSGHIFSTNTDGRFGYEVEIPEGVPLDANDLLFAPPSGELEIPPETLLLELPFFFSGPPFSRPFENIRFYDFDPKLPRKSTPITGMTELEEDGSNLAIVLRDILDNDKQKRKLTNLVSDLLPFVENLRVERFLDKSLFFSAREKYSGRSYLPASLLSDGTISIISLIVALYFAEKAIVTIEEPERNIHPTLISRMISMMKEVAQKKQIIVTTHNPQVVKHVEVEDLLLVRRDENGFSVISRPAEREDIKVFLENEIGIAELFADGLLGV